MGSGLHLRIDSCADGWEVALHGHAIGKVCRIAAFPTRAEAVNGWEVALHGHAIGKVCRIAAFPTRAEAVSRAELEEKERSVPFVVEEAADGT